MGKIICICYLENSLLKISSDESNYIFDSDSTRRYLEVIAATQFLKTDHGRDWSFTRSDRKRKLGIRFSQ